MLTEKAAGTAGTAGSVDTGQGRMYNGNKRRTDRMKTARNCCLPALPAALPASVCPADLAVILRSGALITVLLNRARKNGGKCAEN